MIQAIFDEAKLNLLAVFCTIAFIGMSLNHPFKRLMWEFFLVFI